MIGCVVGCEAGVIVGARAYAKGPRNALNNFDANHTFLALCVTALTHDSAVFMDYESRFKLFADFANIELIGWSKPVTALVCVFWTKLIGAEHCSDDLAATSGSWSAAIEIDLSGRLSPSHQLSKFNCDNVRRLTTSRVRGRRFSALVVWFDEMAPSTLDDAVIYDRYV